MASLSQATRPARVTTTLGADKLVLARLVAEEGLSAPYRYTLDLLSLDPAIDTGKLLRTPLGVTLDLADGARRHFHGIVSRCAHVGRSDDLTTYRVEVVPKLWFLGLSRDSRCFLGRTAKEIVETVLRDAGISEYTWALAGTPPAREYCVQYAESGLDFVHRLLEEEGIFYFFTHTDGGHKLVLTDQNSAMGPVAGRPQVRFSSHGATTDPDVVTSLLRESVVHPGQMTMRDYDFTKPSTRIESVQRGVGDEEVYDYPARVETRDRADKVARRRLEAVEALERTAQGAGHARQLQPGHRFKVTDHYDAGANAEYYLVNVRHVLTQGGWQTEDHTFEYANTFTAAPFKVPYRPLARTPRPYIPGPQTAVVVGPQGEEIYTDRYGRVKVQFHWDRKGERNEKSSAWVRVATSWAGKNWGAVHIPRIGQEVVVAFTEGDPDQPLVIGAVYNAEQMPPYELPANMTQSGIMSRSTKQGAAADFNAIRFEDKKGAELIHLHAQRDLEEMVERNATVRIQQHRDVTLSADGADKVGNDTLTLKKGDQKVTLTEGNQTITLTKGNYAFEATEGNGRVVYKKGNLEELLDRGNRTLTLSDGNRTTTLKQGNDKTELTNGNLSVALTKGSYTAALTNGNHEVKVTKGNAVTEVTAGDVTMKAATGAVTIEALKELTLKVGASTVTLKPTGIEMKLGANTVAITPAGVEVKGTMAKVEGMAMAEIKAPMTQVNGQAMLKMQGAITMIN